MSISPNEGRQANRYENRIGDYGSDYEHKGGLMGIYGVKYDIIIFNNDYH